jgi:cytochrome d ubiquinol oxidase subunit II
MTLAEWMISLMWLGLTAYVLFGGADFGAGFWDLLAGGAERGANQRALIDHSIGPVWEANHVWLIFVLVLCWTGFPGVFASVASTMYVPLMLTALGIIARGSAFAFRKASTELGQRRLYGAAFALSSVLTPFFLGTVAGGIASGRTPMGIARGDVITSWANPTSVLGGVLAVAVSAYLSAVYLCADARREHPELAATFRRKALGAAAVTGVIALAGIAVLRADAPVLFAGLLGRGAPLIIISVAAGLLALVLLWVRAYLPARAASGVAVAALLWGWAAAQYPLVLLPDTTIQQAAATTAVLEVSLVVTVLGMVVLVPSLWWMFSLFQRTSRQDRES